LVSSRSSSSLESPGPAASWAGAALLALFTALFFHAVVAGGRFYVLDFHQTFQPFRTVLGEALGEGWPLWSSRLGNGVPLLANPLHAALYPFNLLFAVLPSPATLTWLTLFHVLLGALGAWRLARSWELGGPGAWTAAIVFAFGGAAVSATAFANLCWSQAWLPWLLLTWQAATRSGARHRLAATAALALVAALMLSLGEPIVLVAGLLALILFSLAESLRRVREEPSGLFALWGPPLAALPVALLLTSPFLLAFGAYAPASMRAIGFSPEGILLWSLHPAMALDLLLPAPFGDPDLEGVGGFWAVATAPEKGFPLFRGLYVGALALGLALLGALRRWRGRWPSLALLALLSLLALGRHGPLYPRLLELSFLDSLRYPVKWILPALLPLALLAGSGVRGIEQSTPAGAARRRALVVLLLTAGLLAVLSVAATSGLDGWLIGLAHRGADQGTISREWLRVIRGGLVGAVGWASLPLLLGAAAIWAGGKKTPAWAALCLAAMITADLGWANRRLAPTVTTDFYDDPPASVRVLRAEPELPGRVWIEDPWAASVRLVPPPQRAVDRFLWQRRALLGYVGAAYGLDLAFPKDTEQFAPVTYTRLRVMMESAPLREKLMLLGAAGVTHLVAFGLDDVPLLERVAVVPGPTDRPQTIWRNRLALPRARLVRTLLPYEGDAGFIEAVNGHPDDLFRRVALVEIGDLRASDISPEGLPPPNWDGPPSTPGAATVVEDRGRVIRVKTSGTEGYLVVSDLLLPGWKAFLDGREIPLLRADYAFRAVALPAGEHEVVMRFGLR
jgi:hypothetical protein